MKGHSTFAQSLPYPCSCRSHAALMPLSIRSLYALYTNPVPKGMKNVPAAHVGDVCCGQLNTCRNTADDHKLRLTDRGVNASSGVRF